MTKVESARITRMMRLGCVACAHLELPVPAQECHHILYGNIRMGHLFTIPLCMGHHRGCWSAEQLEAIPADKRVAISNGRKAFTLVYPDERTLWEQVQRRLMLTAAWPTPKLVARRA